MTRQWLPVKKRDVTGSYDLFVHMSDVVKTNAQTCKTNSICIYTSWQNKRTQGDEEDTERTRKGRSKGIHIYTYTRTFKVTL